MVKFKNGIVVLFLISNFLIAQVKDVETTNEIKPLIEKVNLLHDQNQKLKSKCIVLDNKISTLFVELNNLKDQNVILTQTLSKSTNDLGVKIKATGEKNEDKIIEVSESLSENSIYGIIGVLLVFITSTFLFVLVKKRQDSQKNDLIDQLSKTKSSIEESLVKEFEKQTVQIENQIAALNSKSNSLSSNTNNEPDHSLALKVASEINLIERNISLMDSGTKGLKQLSKSVLKLKDNLAANGYEMPEMLGKQYHQGMKVIVVTTIPDENLNKDEELITKILIPQVNYNDKMIQTAQIETSKGI